MAVMKRLGLEAEHTKGVPRSVLNREELLQIRREQYQADKERIRQMSPAEQSVERWLKWRQRNPDKGLGLTAEDSVRKWLAYREAEKLSEVRQKAGLELSRDDDDSKRRRKAMERSKGHGLEF